MLLGDWLILIGWTLAVVGVTGWTLLVLGVTGWTLPRAGRGLEGRDFANQGRRRRPSLRDSISTLLLRWHREGSYRAALHANVAKLRVDAHDLTDHACRLADGSMGHVAVIAGTDEEWTVVCVPA